MASDAAEEEVRAPGIYIENLMCDEDGSLLWHPEPHFVPSPEDLRKSRTVMAEVRAIGQRLDTLQQTCDHLRETLEQLQGERAPHVPAPPSWSLLRGFVVQCVACGSQNAALTNTLVWPVAGRPAGSISLVCQACRSVCVLYDPDASRNTEGWSHGYRE